MLFRGYRVSRNKLLLVAAPVLSNKKIDWQRVQENINMPNRLIGDVGCFTNIVAASPRQR